MKLSKTLPLAVASTLLAGSAHAALLVHYDFDSDAAGGQADGNSITNNAGAAGTVGGTAGGVANIASSIGPGGVSGQFLSLAPTADNLEGVAAPHVNSNNTIAGLNVRGNDNYTFAAYVLYQSNTNDNMVFGGATGNVIHLGARGSDHWSGHWGDDVNSAGAPSTELDKWHHVAWTNTAGTNEQSIYIDGVLAISGGAGAAAVGGYTANDAIDLLIGTSRNQGSFRGAIDDIRVYDNVLSAAEIQALVVPEPAGIALIGLAGFSLLLRRRRR